MTDDEDRSRTKRVTFYVNESEQNALKREADQRDKSLSAYCLQLVRRQRQLDAEEQLSEDLNVEQRLAEVTTQAVEEIEQTVESVEDASDALRDLHARAGTYPLVNFRLLMRQHRPPEVWVNEQFDWASNKLRVPLSEHAPTEDLSLNTDSEMDGSEDDSGSTDVDDLV